MAEIGIVGMGVVGKALAAYYRTEYRVQSTELYSYDKATDGPEALDALNQHADIVFICVGTPYHPDGLGLDCSQVHTAVEALTRKKMVIIKSTVMPGTTDAIQANHSEHRVFFVPEFVNQDTAVEDYVNPRRPHIIGVPHNIPLSAPEELKALLPSPFRGFGRETIGAIAMDARQAELLKLATNAFYALKVSFANMLYDIGVTQDTLDALGTDSWIYPYHLRVMHKGYRGFGGSCLPKDTEALLDYTEQQVDVFSEFDPRWCAMSDLLDLVIRYNKRLLSHQGRDEYGREVKHATAAG